MATIIALGGISEDPEKQRIIRSRIISSTPKERPRLIYIPADGGEDRELLPMFARVYGPLVSEIEPLFLLRNRPTSKQIEEQLARADIVFVGGGNTLRLMRMWRRFGLDEMLRKLAKRDVVLTGVSAGGICWFEWGHSDSRSFSGKPDWKYIRVAGLGLVPGTFCPHVLGENRMENFRALMAKTGGIGYGVNDGAALEVKDGKATILGDGGVFRVIGANGRTTVEELNGSFRLS